MTQTQIVIIFILLLGIGISLLANNFIHSLVVNLFLHNDSLSVISTRMIGFALVISSVLFILRMYDICIIILCFLLVIFTFLVMRGKTRAQLAARKRKQELIDIHQNEVQARMNKIQHLRDKLDAKQQTRVSRNISHLRRSKWDDGRPTNQEIIEEFSK